ncbi:glycosyltransferase [Flavobacterium salilacus subsp. salilacus]|uniref:glycosyltransferase n=1 Tax=Flavobacterium TaxID=237 RepID=UPI0010750A04|nr:MULTISPECIES: glycosyltransferase [Flavobacterium]KAF2519401.1 glycosyltransferase [Flavobacterium salilacus subsp. salilacus]MBE1614707.1 glycosyltransferase [Flavobacterium sp. SaA2.13]
MVTIIFYVFVGVSIVQLVYYLAIFGKFAFAKSKPATPKKIPISVIVCAKNEAEKVKQFVPLLAAQNYPDFEIVLIDDASADDTLDIFEEFEKQYSNVKLVKVENNEAFWGNKKYALTLGIKAASKEYLLFTDADCYPATTDWITQMSSHFTLNKTIVLGYGGYEKVKNSFLNKIIRFDTMLMATQYFAWAKLGKPYTGEGRNLAYKREEFFKVNGFIDHMNIRTGEDALFINQAATPKNTTVCYSPESFTYCEAKKTFKDWFAQKRRHDYTTAFFSTSDKLQLRVYTITQVLFFILAILLLSLQYDWRFTVPVIALRYLASWVTIGYSAAKLKEKDVIYWFPIIEIIITFTKINVFFTNMFSKPVHWK